MNGYAKAGIGLLLAVIAGGIIFTAAKSRAQNSSAEEPEEKTYTYQVKTIKIEPGYAYSFSVTADVKAGQSANLIADRRARVKEILVKPGDAVAEGQTLLRLHSDELESSFLNTTILYTNAQANVATTEAVARNMVETERLRMETAQLQLQNTLAQNVLEKKRAEEQLASAKLNLTLSVQSAQTAVETAQKQYTNQLALNTANRLVAETGLRNTVRALRTDVFSGLNIMNELLDVDAGYRGNAGLYTDRLGVRSQDSKPQAEMALKKAISSYEASEETYDSTKQAAIDAEDALDKTLKMLNYTIPTGDLTQTVLSGYLSAVSQTLAAVRGGLSGLESAQGSFMATMTANDASLTAAKQQIEAAENALAQAKQDQGGTSQFLLNAQAQYDAIISQLKASEDAARKGAETAALAYANAKQNADLQVLGAKNVLLSSQDALDQMKLSRAKLDVKSTFSGRVASVNANLGEEVNAGTVLVSVENPESIKVEAQLGETDILRVQYGDAVKIGDAAGTIIAIAQSADSRTKKYLVEIRPESAETLKPGQFVRVTFTVAEATNIERIFVPVTAVHIAETGSFVWTIRDGKTAKMPVIFGELQGDTVEIISGLASGQEIITEGGRIIEEEGTPVEVLADPV